MARPKKDPYENLSDDFKGKVEGASDEQLVEILGEVAKAEELNRRIKEDDQELQEKKAQYEMSGEQYKESTKANKLKTRYIYDILRARGKAE
jgi:hypothetical protein